MSLEQTQNVIHQKEQNQMHPKHWTNRTGNPHPKRTKQKIIVPRNRRFNLKGMYINGKKT